MFICRVCKLKKDEDEFYWKNKSKGKKQSECKDCTKKMVADDYQKSKSDYIKRINKSKQSKKQWLVNYKLTLKCEKCEENHPAVLDFHHIDPSQKESEVTTIVFTRNWSIERIKKEIEKCVVLCSNCHRKLHWEEKRHL